MTVMNIASKLQCRKMAWMKERVWDWHVVFTDAFKVLVPVKVASERWFSEILKNLIAFYCHLYNPVRCYYCCRKKETTDYAIKLNVC